MGMKRPTIPAVTALLLLIAGCSSGDPSSSNVSPTASDTPQGQAPATDPMCESVNDYALALIELSFLASSLEELLAVEDIAAAPSAESMHDSASLVLAATDDLDAALIGAVEAIDDADAAEILEAYHESLAEMTRWIATTTLESTDFADLATRFESDLAELEALAAAFNDIDPAPLGDYLDRACGTNCGLANYSNSSANTDTATKYDVATLGKEISIYYVDNYEPDPVITIVDGSLYLLDENLGPASAGVSITDQYYNDSTDWCVELTNPSGRLARFTYSAQSGLENGSC